MVNCGKLRRTFHAGISLKRWPRLLVLLCFIIRKFAAFDPGKESTQAVAKIITYALIANLLGMCCGLCAHTAGIDHFFGYIWDRAINADGIIKNCPDGEAGSCRLAGLM